MILQALLLLYSGTIDKLDIFEAVAENLSSARRHLCYIVRTLHRDSRSPFPCMIVASLLKDVFNKRENNIRMQASTHYLFFVNAILSG